MLLFSTCRPSYQFSYENPNEPVFNGSFIQDQHISEETTSFKIVTFNIEFAQNISGAIDLLSSQELMDCDVLLLQEMDENGVLKIAEHLKLSYVYYPAIYHPKHERNVGNAILSKWPISKTEKFITGFSSSYPVMFEGKNYKFNKTATIAQINIKNNLVSFVTTHAPAVNTTSTKKAFAEKIASHAQGLGHYVIVTGDFNTFGAFESEETAKSFSQNGFNWISADVGTTVSSVKPTLKSIPKTAFQLDHIFTKGFEVNYVSTIPQKGVSDHLPLVAEITFSE
ncbi:MAG: endonuclease/exonuclease/phosphatase family protein [Saprospiraceae bacterium]|nr:endonuclease/exonuclease/phosphatase family protein [Saprospiraceae bacterium]